MTMFLVIPRATFGAEIPVVNQFFERNKFLADFVLVLLFTSEFELLTIYTQNIYGHVSTK